MTQTRQTREVYTGLPVLYGDTDQLGEADFHVAAVETLHVCLKAHLRRRPRLRVFSGMALVHNPDSPYGYVVPDIMVVEPAVLLGKDLSSYQVGKEGPCPILVIEVLSWLSWQWGDLSFKPKVYARLGVSEFLPVRMQRLQQDGTWQEERDRDGGVTSHLGFRLLVDSDDRLLILDAKTGTRYVTPDEAQSTVETLEQRNRELETELKLLRQAGEKPSPK
jgi:hypothetical protein